MRFEGATTSRIPFWKNDNPSDFGMHRTLEHGDIFVVLEFHAINDLTFFKVVDSSGAVGSLPSPNSEAYWKVVKL